MCMWSVYVCMCVRWKPIWKWNRTLWHNTDFTDHLDKKTLEWKFDQKMHFERKWTFFFIQLLLRTWFEQHAWGGVMKKSKKWNWLIWDNLWLVPPERHSPFTLKMNPLDSGSKCSCKPSVSFFSPFYKMEGQTMGGGLVMKWCFSQHISVASFLQPKADANWWWLPTRPLFKGLLFLIGTKLKYKFKRGCRRSLGCVQENKIVKN